MADTKISDLTAGGALAGTEPVPMVQDGATKRTTPDAIRDRAIGSLASLTSAGTLAGTETLGLAVSGNPRSAAVSALLAYIRALLTDRDVPATVVTESGTSRAMANSDAGSYIRFTNTSAKTATFGTGVNVVGQEFHVRNVGANNLTLTPSSTTLNAPAGGTLIVPPGGTVTVKQVDATEFDVFGSTT